ncbi:hypothetical protein FVE85_2905 [Porphyridium purpureum]|uniref:Pentatricopeptide repeat-containing protein n=1 Tax=Porphyridium purpureum TaxID=35688 RepID=A0A5J4YVD1_PORPP|nr:hypothetical protein FVE85_2905 [Porphyridium purpureum]|eukprot:POR1105..scf227_4
MPYLREFAVDDIRGSSMLVRGLATDRVNGSEGSQYFVDYHFRDHEKVEQRFREYALGTSLTSPVLSVNTLIEELQTLPKQYVDQSRFACARQVYLSGLALGIMPDVRVFNELLQYAVRKNTTGDTDMARTAFDMRFVIDQALMYGVQLDTTSYNLLMGQHVQVDDVNGAFSLYQKMRMLGVPRDLKTYEILIQGACRSLDHQGRVKPLWDAMVEDKIDPGHSFAPYLIECEKLRENWSGGIRIYDDIPESERTMAHRRCVLDLVVAGSHYDEACKYIDELLAFEEVKTDKEMVRELYTQGLLVAARTGRKEAAIEFMKSLARKDVQPHFLHLGDILSALLDRPELYPIAIVLSDRTMKYTIRQEEAHRLLELYCNMDDRARAKEVMRMMNERGSSTSLARGMFRRAFGDDNSKTSLAGEDSAAASAEATALMTPDMSGTQPSAKTDTETSAKTDAETSAKTDTASGNMTGNAAEVAVQSVREEQAEGAVEEMIHGLSGTGPVAGSGESGEAVAGADSGETAGTSEKAGDGSSVNSSQAEGKDSESATQAETSDPVAAAEAEASDTAAAAEAEAGDAAAAAKAEASDAAVAAEAEASDAVVGAKAESDGAATMAEAASGDAAVSATSNSGDEAAQTSMAKQG